MTLALIDGDIVAYRAATAGQKTFNWGEGVTSLVEVEPAVAASAAIQTVNEWAAAVNCKDIMVAFTGLTNFRTRVLPTYKLNRKSVTKPAAFYAAREAIQATFNTHLIEGLEADDLLGILATNPKYEFSVVVSLDKDLRTVPGWHFNPNKDTEAVVVGEHRANWFWMTQTLTGDPVDGYTGIPGIGKVKAERILGNCYTMSDLWRRVCDAYRAAKLTETHALVQARVARILRFTDYDKEGKRVGLWHPTKTEWIPVHSSTPQPASGGATSPDTASNPSNGIAIKSCESVTA